MTCKRLNECKEELGYDPSQLVRWPDGLINECRDRCPGYSEVGTHITEVKEIHLRNEYSNIDGSRSWEFLYLQRKFLELTKERDRLSTLEKDSYIRKTKYI